MVLHRPRAGRRGGPGGHGYRLHAVLTLRELVDALEREGTLAAAEAQRVRDYLAALRRGDA